MNAQSRANRHLLFLIGLPPTSSHLDEFPLTTFQRMKQQNAYKLSTHKPNMTPS